MRVHPLHDDEGQVFAFEIENDVIGRRGVCHVVSGIPGATLLRRPVRFLSWFREETFCEFELDGVSFLVWEPFGDNSRYWIGAEPPRLVPQLQVVRQTFLDHHPLREHRLVRIVIAGALVAAVWWIVWGAK